MARQSFIGSKYALYSTETGLHEGDKVITKKVSSDKFIRVYLEDIGALIQLTDGEIRVLQCIWDIAEFNTGRVMLIASVKEDILEALKKSGKEMKKATIGNIISNLVKRNMLIPVPERRANYILNPKYFWKGEEIERGNSFRLILEYRRIEPTENDNQSGDDNGHE